MEFDKQFVHCVWDESLVGKLCVFADDIPELKTRVERQDPHYTAVLQEPCPNADTDMDTWAYPFYKDANAPTGYRFVYYDPYLQCKIAHEQGKQIQYFDCEEWLDIADPTWLPDTKYRIKPEPEPEPDEHASDAERKYVPYDSVSEMLCDHFNVDCIEDIKNCIWLRLKGAMTVRYMITGMSRDEVCIEGNWISLSLLLEEYLWDDYTVIGK